MSRFRLLMVLVVALAFAAGVAACGGGGGNGDEDEITDVVETSVSSTDPADCTKLQTQKFLEQTQAETGDAALKACEESAADTSDNPDSTEVSNVSVDGDAATAEATFEGGILSGSTISLALVKEGDQWKIDELTDIPDFDFEGFQQELEASLGESGDVPQGVTDCITQNLQQTGEEQVKQIFLTGDQQQLLGIIQPCVQG